MQSKTTKKANFVIVYSYLLFALLLHVGTSKLLNHKTTLFEYSISPNLRPVADILSISIPAVEIAIGLLLFFNRTRLIGLIAAAALFIIYLIAMFNLKLYVPNIRGGLLIHFSFYQYVIINCGLLILTLASTIVHLRKKKQFQDRPEPPNVIFDENIQSIIAQ